MANFFTIRFIINFITTFQIYGISYTRKKRIQDAK